jgi:hypothetical protein
MPEAPLILSFSRNLALARLSLKSCHIRERIWQGEGTTELPSPWERAADYSLSPWGEGWGEGGLSIAQTAAGGCA